MSTLDDVSVPAFKEWAVIVHALLEGEQILDVRKGGLHEDGRRFGVKSRRCWLYPTAEHQRPELLKPAYRQMVDLAAGSRVGEPIRIDGWADIVGTATVTDPEQLAALDSKLIWSQEYAESRLQWKKRQPLWVLAMRVHRLRRPARGAVARGVRRLHVVGRPPRPAPRSRRARRASPRCPTPRSRRAMKGVDGALGTPLEEPALD